MRGAKRLAALLLSIALFLFCACGDGGTPMAPRSALPAESSHPGKPLRAAMVLDGGIEDSGWNMDSYTGLLQARDILDFRIDVMENATEDTLVDAFRQYAEKGYDLIVAPGQQYQEAVEAIHTEYPASHFAGINFTFTAENVTSLNFNNLQAGFLAGALAAMQTQTSSVGYIGGDDIAPTLDAMRGMGQGIKYVRDDVQFTISTTGVWNNPAKAMQLAEKQISAQGVDVILSYGDACNQGVVQAAEGKGSCILLDSVDLMNTNPEAICGSVLLSNSDMIMFAAHLVVGEQTGQAMIGDVTNGVVRLGSFGQNVAEDTMEKLLEVYGDIALGRITLV